jgi:hypothetical protein
VKFSLSGLYGGWKEIINIAKYLNTKYKGDQFVNIVKNHESTQPNMSSIVKLAAKLKKI